MRFDVPCHGHEIPQVRDGRTSAGQRRDPRRDHQGRHRHLHGRAVVRDHAARGRRARRRDRQDGAAPFRKPRRPDRRGVVARVGRRHGRADAAVRRSRRRTARAHRPLRAPRRDGARHACRRERPPRPADDRRRAARPSRVGRGGVRRAVFPNRRRAYAFDRRPRRRHRCLRLEAAAAGPRAVGRRSPRPDAADDRGVTGGRPRA